MDYYDDFTTQVQIDEYESLSCWDWYDGYDDYDYDYGY